MKKQFYINNREKTIRGMKDNSCLILLSGSPPVSSNDQHYAFQPTRNFLYLTGIARPNLILFIAKYSNMNETTLFIPDENVEGNVDFPIEEDEAKKLSGVESIKYINEFDSMISRHIARKPCEIVYFDFTRLDVNAAQMPIEAYANEFKQKYPGLLVKDIHKTICSFRVVKSDCEIDEIRKAVSITKDGIIRMIEICKPGINECELEAEFMYHLIKKGERVPAFGNIIASGRNSMIGHYGANNKIVEDDVLVLVDVGAQSNWYCSDVSRAFPSNGKYNDRQKQLYNICYDAMDKMIEFIKPGITMKQTIEYGRDLISSGLNKIGVSEENTKDLYIYCGFNHFVGLDTHDVGDRSQPLAPNMVIAVDSAVAIPEEEIDFRIEDDLLITENGCEVLTRDIPKTIEDIEALYHLVEGNAKFGGKCYER